MFGRIKGYEVKSSEFLQYIIKKFYEFDNDISNLKLQKLLYITQAACLVIFDEGFDDRVEAWCYGPTVPSANEDFRYNKEDIVNKQFDFESERLDEVISQIWKDFGGFTSFELVDLLQSYAPWKEAFWDDCSNLISKCSIKRFHKKLLKETEYMF